MKKVLTITLALALIMTLLAGCGGGSDLSGKFIMTEWEMGGENYMELLGMAGMSASDFYIEFLSGGKFKMSVAGDSQEGEFKVSGNTVTLSLDGEGLDAKRNGNKITIEDEDYGKMVFEKK